MLIKIHIANEGALFDDNVFITKEIPVLPQVGHVFFVSPEDNESFKSQLEDFCDSSYNEYLMWMPKEQRDKLDDPYYNIKKEDVAEKYEGIEDCVYVTRVGYYYKDDMYHIELGRIERLHEEWSYISGQK